MGSNIGHLREILKKGRKWRKIPHYVTTGYFRVTIGHLLSFLFNSFLFYSLSKHEFTLFDIVQDYELITLKIIWNQEDLSTSISSWCSTFAYLSPNLFESVVASCIGARVAGAAALGLDCLGTGVQGGGHPVTARVRICQGFKTVTALVRC